MFGTRFPYECLYGPQDLQKKGNMTHSQILVIALGHFYINMLNIYLSLLLSIIAYPKNPGDTIIPLNTRIYMAYDHTSKTSMNIMYQPYGSECIPALRDFLSFSERLDMDCDPFGVHLIYVGRATTDWRKVIQDITNELTHYVRVTFSTIAAKF